MGEISSGKVSQLSPSNASGRIEEDWRIPSVSLPTANDCLVASREFRCVNRDLHRYLLRVFWYVCSSSQFFKLFPICIGIWLRQGDMGRSSCHLKLLIVDGSPLVCCTQSAHWHSYKNNSVRGAVLEGALLPFSSTGCKISLSKIQKKSSRVSGSSFPQLCNGLISGMQGAGSSMGGKKAAAKEALALSACYTMHGLDKQVAIYPIEPAAVTPSHLRFPPPPLAT